MSVSGWQGYVEENARRLVWAGAVAWTILMAASLLWNLHQVREFALELARNEAQLSFNKDLAHRLWGARHGGVYVPVTPESPPNPYLAHVPERDLQTPAGRALTLVNPAYMTRQVQELAANLYGTRGHLTSLKPLRPENAPDDWERKVLAAFEAGGTEVIETASMAGEPYMRLMRPWRTETACLKCHAEQGYQVGDIRGGISVAVPMQPYLAGIRTQTRHLAVGHGLIWLLGAAGILGGGRRLEKQWHERQQAAVNLAETLRQKEEALALLDAIFDSAPIGLGFWDRDLRFVRLNKSLAEINGYTVQEHLGRRVDEMVHGLEDVSELMATWRQILETGEPRLNVEISGNLASNPTETHTWQDNWFPVRRGDQIIGLAATVTDVTARVRAEAEIKRLASFPQLNPNPVLEIAADGAITYANQAALTVLKELGPDACVREFLPTDWEEITKATREKREKVFQREVRINNAVFSEAITFVEPFDVWRIYASDITERQRAEAELRESEARFRSLFENMTEGVVLHEMIYDGDGRAVDYRILAANPAFTKHTGMSAKHLQGQPASQAYAAGEAPYLDIYARVAQTGEPSTFETFFPPLQRHFHISVTSPKQGHFVTVFEDITERRNMEEALRAQASELAKVIVDLEEKNAEMERFTYMISHDLKSPLVTISTFLGYLENDMQRGDTARIAKDMEFMRAAAKKMGQLLSDLLEMSRVGRVVNPSVEVTFQELVADALNAVAGPLVGRGLEVQVTEADVALYGDRPRLAEIWQNLVENGVKFMGEQSAPRLEIGCQRQEGQVVFFVCDNGIGLEPHYKEKIFGLFEKLDPASEGTGIGLAFVKRIVELYKGTIWVESAGPGQGACFRFTLPGAVRADAPGKREKGRGNGGAERSFGHEDWLGAPIK